MDRATSQPRIETERPRYPAAITEDLLTGSRRLRHAFLQQPICNAARDMPLVRLSDSDPTILLIRTGFAFRSCALADGRRAILHIVTPGDVVGLDHIVLHHPIEEVTAATRVEYRALRASGLRELMKDDPAINLQVIALLADIQWRTDRLAAALGRLDAQARICFMLSDVYERLRRRELISRFTFNLPLTQEQIADHLGLTLVHVNRTLRRLREERIAIIDRQVVIIMDLDRLRKFAQGLPESAELLDTVPAGASLQRMSVDD